MAAVNACAKLPDTEAVLSGLEEIGFKRTRKDASKNQSSDPFDEVVSDPSGNLKIEASSQGCIVGLEGMTPEQSYELALPWVDAYGARTNASLGQGLSQHVIEAWRATSPQGVPIFIAAYKTWPLRSNVASDLPGSAVRLSYSQSPPKETPSEMSVFFGFPSAAELRESLLGRTIVFNDRFHGTQVEYFKPDGTATLWYPGNFRGVPSLWKTRQLSDDRVRMCFLYPSSSYNPVTEETGGTWECRSGRSFTSNIVAIVEGDVFNIGGGSVPKPLPKKTKMSLEDLQAFVGKPISEKIIFEKSKN